jgi:hypothetical protein
MLVIVRVIVALCPALIDERLDESPRVHDGSSLTVIVLLPVAVPGVRFDEVAVTVNGLVYVPVCDAVSWKVVDCVPIALNVSVLLQVVQVSPLFGDRLTVTVPVSFESDTVAGTVITSFLYRSVW